MNIKDIEKLINRIRSGLRYLKLAKPVYSWRIIKGECPKCDGKFFLKVGDLDFFIRCLKCRANLPNLALIPVIKNAFGERLKDAEVYELSTYGATLEFLSKNCKKVFVSEYFPDEAFGVDIAGVRNEDIQKLTYENEVFDLVTSTSVMEHVPDDIRGFSECYRVLKNDGALIFTVPLYDTKSSLQMAKLDDENNVVHLEVPEYHDSRLGGPKSALAFWRHSYNDISDRLKTAGFDEVQVLDVKFTHSNAAPTKVIFAKKSA